MHTAYFLLAAVVLHLIEEYALGDFLGWFRRVAPSLAPAMTTRWAVGMNAGFLIGVAIAVSPLGHPLVVLAMAALCAINSLLHLVMSVRTRSWSPGVVTGILLYVPLAAYYFVSAWQGDEFPSSWVVGAGVAGALLHLIPVLTLVVRVSRRGTVDT